MAQPGGKVRLDIALEQRGLARSRARARDAVLRGTVMVNGVCAVKPGQKTCESDVLELADRAARYVSRAALKLIAGLEASGILVTGKTCLDVGASTGGFTQVLLERGAKRVYAVDAGRGQLHETLCTNARVISLERTNGRDLDPELIPESVSLLVCDVSFVSVTKILAPSLALCGEGADAVILIKPQFEVGPGHVGKGGVVTDDAAREIAILGVIAFVEGQGFGLRHRAPASIAGRDGNREEIAVFRKNTNLAK